jgi:uncharacterized protein DUF1707
MVGPGDKVAAGADGQGHRRASHIDREQVIEVLKAAFVQGRLARDEFDLRVSRALASRTYGDLAVLTADLPGGLAATQPPPPAWAPGEPRIPRPVLVLTVATVVYAAVWPVVFVLPDNSEGEPPGGGALVVTATFFYLIVLLMIGTPILADRLNERFARQLPRRPGPGAGGQASPRLPPSGPAG